MRLKALDRLVIVDACQAESILAGPAGRRDPEVDGTGGAQGPDLLPHGRPPRRARASRSTRWATACSPTPCSAAWEPSSAGDEPEEIAELGLPANADFNADGILTTTELDAYVSQNLKAIARVFPDLVASREAELPVGKPRVPAGARAAPDPPELRLVVPPRAAENRPPTKAP